MLSALLTTSKLRTRSGASPERSRSAGRSSFTAGRDARTNGLISSSITGVVARRNGRVWRSDGPSARAPGRSACSVGPSSSPSALALPSAVCVSPSVEGSSRSVARRFASWFASAAKTAFELSTNSASWSSLAPSSSSTSEKLWIARLMFSRRSASPSERARVAGGRLEAPDRVGQLAPVAVEPLRAIRQQQLEVAARVAVERGQDLVEVDVRQRLADRDALAVLQLAGLLR